MINAVSHGMVGFQSTTYTESRKASVAMLRALYTEGKLSLAQAVKVAKPSDHGKAIASGKVTIDALVKAGVDLHACQVAYNRATGNGATSKARKASGSASSVEAKLLASDDSAAMARLVAQRKAQRNAAKAAKAGKVYTQAEIAALAATLGK